MVAILVLVTEKLGHSDIIVVGATEAGDGKSDGNWDEFCVRCNEGMADGMTDGIRVGREFLEDARVGMDVEGLRVEGVRDGMEVEGEVGVFARIWTNAWCCCFTSDSIDN